MRVLRLGGTLEDLNDVLLGAPPVQRPLTVADAFTVDPAGTGQAFMERYVQRQDDVVTGVEEAPPERRPIGYSTGGVPLYEPPTDGRIRYGVTSTGVAIYGFPEGRDAWLSMNPQVAADRPFVQVAMPEVQRGVVIDPAEWHRLQAELDARIAEEARRRDAFNSPYATFNPQAAQENEARLRNATPNAAGVAALARMGAGSPTYYPQGVAARVVSTDPAMQAQIDAIQGQISYANNQVQATSEHRTIEARNAFRSAVRNRLDAIENYTRSTWRKVGDADFGPRRY